MRSAGATRFHEPLRAVRIATVAAFLCFTPATCLRGAAAEPPAPEARPVVVAQAGGGDVRTIGDALAKVADGGTIRVRPGTYREVLNLKRAVAIEADGDAKDVVIDSETGPCVTLLAECEATIRGCSLRAKPRPKRDPDCVVLSQRGTLVLDACDVSGEASQGIWTTGEEAQVVLRGCKIHDTREYGVFTEDSASLRIEGGEVSGAKQCGVMARSAAKVVIKGGLIRSNGEGGLLLREKATGRLESVVFEENGGAQIFVMEDAVLTLIDSKVRGGSAFGLNVESHGRAVLDRCEVTGNAQAGIRAADPGTSLATTGGGISKNGAGGATIDLSATATFEDGEADGNKSFGIGARGGATATLRRMRVHGQVAGVGVIVQGKGRAHMDGCDVGGNALDQMRIESSSEADVRLSKFHGGKATGVLVEKAAHVSLADVEIWECDVAEFVVRNGGVGTAERCVLRDGKGRGVWVTGTDSKATLEVCDVSGHGASGIYATDNCWVTLTGSKVRDGKEWGAAFEEIAHGLFADTEISGNGGGGIRVESGSDPTVKTCKIRKNAGVGIEVRAAKGIYQGCDFAGNSAGAWTVDGGSAVTRQGNHPNK